MAACSSGKARILSTCITPHREGDRFRRGDDAYVMMLEYVHGFHLASGWLSRLLYREMI